MMTRRRRALLLGTVAATGCAAVARTGTPDACTPRAPGPDHTLCTGDDVVTTRDPGEPIA